MNNKKLDRIIRDYRKQIIVFVSLTVILFGLLLTYKYFVEPYCSREKPILVNTRSVREDVTFTSSDDIISQTFSVKECHIKKIAIWINTSGLTDTTDFSIKLKNLDQNQIVEEWQREISPEHGDGGIEFELSEPIGVLEETEFQIELSIIDLNYSGEFAVKCTNWNTYPMGALEINGIQQDSDMVFWIYDNPTMMINNLFVFIVGIIVIGFLVIIYIINNKKDVKEESLFLIMGILLGTLYLWVWAPYSAPDEVRHFSTAYYYSNILLGEEAISDDGQVLMREEELKFNNQEEFTRLSTYSLIVDNLFEISDDNEMIESGETMLNVPWVPYAFQIMGITVGRICNLSCVGVLFLGRIFSFAFYLFVGWLSLRILPSYKKILFVILLFPGVIEIAMSYSYDNMLNCMSFLFFAYLMHLKYRKRNLELKDAIFISVIMCIAVSIKIIYIFLAILCVILVDDWKKIKKKIWLLFPFASSFIMTLIQRITVINSFVSGEKASEALNGWTIGLALEHPFKCIQLALSTVVVQAERWIKELVWAFPEYSNISFSDILPWLFIIILFVVTLDESEKTILTKKEKISVTVLLSCVFISMLGVFLLAELTYTNSIIIGGIQGRYFLPLLPWFMILVRTSKNININIKKYTYLIPTSIFLLNTRFIVEIFVSVIKR